MKFLEEKHKQEFFNLTPYVFYLASYFSWYCNDHFLIDPTVTSIHRPDRSSVHAWGKGIDFRSRDFSALQIELLVAHFNNKFTYDIHRPTLRTLLYHDVGSGFHFHLQSMV